MNKALFLSLALGAATVVGLAAAPAQAQYTPNTQPTGATGYCTGETIQISGWERDLVRKNKGLEKFHWSAINTVQHYQVVPAGSAQRSAARPLTPYHNVKPQVISNWANPKAPSNDKTYLASSENGSRTNTAARLRNYNNNNTATYAQLSNGQGNGYIAQHAGYGGERSAESNVSGRVMHY